MVRSGDKQFIPIYLRWMPFVGSDMQERYAKNFWEVNADLHKRILRYRAGDTCAHCCRFDFGSGEIPILHPIWTMTEAVDANVAQSTGKQDGEWSIEQETPKSCQLCEFIRDIRSQKEAEFQKIHSSSRRELDWPLKCRLKFDSTHHEVPTRRSSVSQ